MWSSKDEAIVEEAKGIEGVDKLIEKLGDEEKRAVANAERERF